MKKKLSHEGVMRVSNKIRTMTEEEKQKPKDQRRSKEQIAAIAYAMEEDGTI